MSVIAQQKIAPCLWFDTQAEDAANFYVSIFKNSRIKRVSRYGNAGREAHGKEPGSVMVVEFELDGQTFTALNGGPQFKFDEAVSFQCIARPRTKSIISGTDCPRAAGKALRLAEGQVRPVLADRAGDSAANVADADGAGTDRVMNALLKMKKFDLAEAAACAGGVGGVDRSGQREAVLLTLRSPAGGKNDDRNCRWPCPLIEPVGQRDLIERLGEPRRIDRAETGSPYRRGHDVVGDRHAQAFELDIPVGASLRRSTASIAPAGSRTVSFKAFT